MARLAATEFGADWVINAEPAEFWWPRGESLRTCSLRSTALHDRQGLRRRSSLRRKRRVFSERMTLRHSVENEPGAAPSSVLRPVHRADPNVVVHPDGSVTVSRQVPLRAWYPLEVFQFTNTGVPERRARRLSRGGHEAP